MIRKNFVCNIQLQKAIVLIEKEMIKTHEPKINSTNLTKPLKRLWLFGSIYPCGYKKEDIKDECSDFDQDILDSLNFTGRPMTMEHDFTIEMGQIVNQFRDINGRHYILGYLDDTTNKSKQAQELVKNGICSELSISNQTSYIENNLKSQEIYRITFPIHVSITKKGQKNQCKILWISEQDMITGKFKIIENTYYSKLPSLTLISIEDLKKYPSMLFFNYFV